MVKSVNTRDLKSLGESLAGSTPAPGRERTLTNVLTKKNAVLPGRGVRQHGKWSIDALRGRLRSAGSASDAKCHIYYYSSTLLYTFCDCNSRNLAATDTVKSLSHLSR